MQDDYDLDSDNINLSIKNGVENHFGIKPHFKVLVFIMLYPYTAALLDLPNPPVMKKLQLSKEVYLTQPATVLASNTTIICNY